MEPETDETARTSADVPADVAVGVSAEAQAEAPGTAAEHAAGQPDAPATPATLTAALTPPVVFAAGTTATAPARRSPRGKALIAAGAVLSVLIGGGIGTYIVKQRDNRNDQAIATANASRAAQVANFAPVAGGVRSDGEHYGALFAFLLPVPGGYTLGPDDSNYGDNGYVSAAQITTQLDDLLSGIPKSDLSNAKGALANTYLKGVAVRTLQTTSSDSDQAQVVSIELLQYDVKEAKSTADGFARLVSDLDVFRTGPSVPGYGSAKCVLPPGLGSDKLDEMLCVGASGDVEVMVDAQGTTPLDMNSIATLVGQQLDRLRTSQTIDR